MSNIIAHDSAIFVDSTDKTLDLTLKDIQSKINGSSDCILKIFDTNLVLGIKDLDLNGYILYMLNILDYNFSLFNLPSFLFVYSDLIDAFESYFDKVQENKFFQFNRRKLTWDSIKFPKDENDYLDLTITLYFESADFGDSINLPITNDYYDAAAIETDENNKYYLLILDEYNKIRLYINIKAVENGEIFDIDGIKKSSGPRKIFMILSSHLLQAEFGYTLIFTQDY